jgi:TolB-like protein
MTSAPDIFLSYNREDQTTAQRFAKAFESQGFSVWWDVTLRSGETYDQVTEEALRTAKAVVVLWSPRSVASRWVRAEATLADRNRTLVPARIEACDLPIMFELTQTADLSQWQGETGDPAWRAFLTDVRRLVETKAKPVPPSRPTAAPSPPLRSSKPSIAVLPFINRSGLSEDDLFAEDMVEDLTAALTTIALEQNRKMKVIAASAAATYRTGVRDLRQIGRDLGARYLLEGNIRRFGDDIRMTVQLVEAEEEDILWSQKFDRPLAELMALQEDLAREIAAHLGVQVNRAEVEQALGKAEIDTIEDAIFRTMHYSTLGTQSGAETAVASARRAVELNPDDGNAYANLAGIQAHLSHLRGGDPQLSQEAAFNIERARTLHSGDPMVLVGIATALAWLRKPQEAVTMASRAVVLSPSYDMAHYALGSALARLGRSDEALAALDASQRVAPNSVRTHYSQRWRSIALLQADRLDEALEAVEQSVRLLPDIDSQLQRILCLAKLGARDEARKAIGHLHDAEPDMSCALAESLVRDLYCGSSAREEYVATIRELWEEMQAEGQA